MNEKQTVKELYNQIKEGRHTLTELASALIGCKPDEVEIRKKENPPPRGEHGEGHG